MADRTLVVRIIGDDRSLNAAFNRSERRTKQFETKTVALGSSVTRVFGAAGIALGGSAIFAFAKRATDEATRLNTEIVKSGQVFGASSKEIEEWSRTTAASIGISQRAALVATGIFGNLFRVLDFGPEKAAEMSRTLVQLAADLAAINSQNPEDVLNALRSGIAGRGAALKTLGIFLTTARINQEALTESGKKDVKTLTDQEKALARYNLILQQAAPSQGGFARESEGLAQQMSVLNAQVEDLSAEMGKVLIPTLTDVVTSLNDAFVVAGKLQTELGKLQAIGGIDIPINLPVSIIFKQGRGKDIRGGLDALKDNIGEALESAFGAGTGPFKDLLERAKGGGGRGFTLFPSSPEREREPPTKKIADKAEKDAKTVEEDAKRVTKARKRQRDAFDVFLKGLGLKLETAGLTKSLQDDLDVLRETERAIERQIRREGRTFERAEELVRVRAQIQDTLADIAAAAEEQQTAKVEKVAKKAEDEREKRKRIREQARVDRQKDLLEDLGLTREGEKPTPSSGSLLRRARSLQDQVQGTPLDTPKTNQQLKRIISVLKKNFKGAGKDVRRAILDMLNDISSAFDQKSGSTGGPLTKTSGLNSKKLLANLGLSEEEIRALRGRLSHFNTAGRALPGSQNRPTGGGFTGGTGFVVENHVTVAIDGKKISSTVEKEQQKTRRRNPRQKRGPNTHR